MSVAETVRAKAERSLWALWPTVLGATTAYGRRVAGQGLIEWLVPEATDDVLGKTSLLAVSYLMAFLSVKLPYLFH